MKSFSFSRVVLLGAIACGVVPIACGDTDEGSPGPSGGSAGKGGGGSAAGGDGDSAGSDSEGGTGAAPLPPGISDAPKTIDCGVSCSSTPVLIGGIFVDPCCAGPAEDECGLDTSFLGSGAFEQSCQPKNQPGELDESCPSPEAAQAPAPGGGGTVTLDRFPGCCRPDTGTCGVMVKAIAVSGIPIANFGLGCVDAAPFFPGEAAVACGSGAGGSGSGGDGGAAGGGGASGGAAAGGGGAGGAP